MREGGSGNKDMKDAAKQNASTTVVPSYFFFFFGGEGRQKNGINII